MIISEPSQGSVRRDKLLAALYAKNSIKNKLCEAENDLFVTNDAYSNIKSELLESRNEIKLTFEKLGYSCAENWKTYC